MLQSPGFKENPVVQLEKVSASGRDLSIGGSTIVVRPLKFMDLVRAIKHLVPIIDLIEKIEKRDGIDSEVHIMEIVEAAPTSLIEIAKLCTGKDNEWFEHLESDEGLEVLAATFEVNRDFFVQRLLPKFQELQAKIMPKKPEPPALPVGLSE